MNIKDSNEPVATNIKRIMDEKGIRSGYIAKQIGVDSSAFSSMLYGRKLILQCHIKKIAEALKVNIEELYK